MRSRTSSIACACSMSPFASKTLELWPTPENDQKVAAIMAHAGWKDNDLKVIIHAAASLPAKQWPLDRFAAVMTVLRDRHHARFVYTGSAGDAALYRRIEELGPFNGLDLCGVTNVRENLSVYRTRRPVLRR